MRSQSQGCCGRAGVVGAAAEAVEAAEAGAAVAAAEAAGPRFPPKDRLDQWRRPGSPQVSCYFIAACLVYANSQQFPGQTVRVRGGSSAAASGPSDVPYDQARAGGTALAMVSAWMPGMTSARAALIIL